MNALLSSSQSSNLVFPSVQEGTNRESFQSSGAAKEWEFNHDKK